MIGLIKINGGFMKIFTLSLFTLILISKTAYADSLKGVWTTDCNAFGRHAIISTITFGDYQFESLENMYERPGCGVQTAKAVFKGSFQLGISQNNGVEFNFVPKELTLTLLKPDVVEHYNKNIICDFSDWELNTPKSILGRSHCIGFTPPLQNEPIYDLLFLHSEQDLKFGSFPFGEYATTPNDRPSAINPNSTRFWKVTENPFNRVERDLKIYDDHITKRRSEFTAIPKDESNIEWIKQKLAFMVEIDQYMRFYFRTPYNFNYSKSEIESFNKSFFPRFAEIDIPNTSDLKALLTKYEWFTISKFGKQADKDAWLLVQHADLDPNFQRQILVILEKLWKIGETNPANYAYLFDRVAASFNDLSKRNLQRYGTQGNCVGPGKWEPVPMEDPANIDQRRKEVGLGTLQEYLAQFKDICK
jgi:hypothetical protein